MKKLLFFFAFIIALGNTTFAQKSKKGGSEIDPPDKVSKAFTLKYKLAKKPVWSQEDVNYRVDFKYNDATMAVCYAEDGKMLYTEKELSKAQHNKTAVKYILENYAGYKILNMKKRDTYDKKTTFVANLRKAKEVLEVEFDKKGGFIRDTDKTPVSVSKKKGKKEDDEETNDDEDKPAKKNTKVKKDKNADDSGDEEATPAKKPEKAKPAPKKTDDNEDEDEVKPATPKKEAAKKPEAPKTETKKKTNDDDDEGDEVKPTTPKKEKEKTTTKPKKEKKKKADDDDDDE